jgi:hypothetical protein
MLTRKPIYSGPPPKPLNRDELARVWRWQRHMILFHAAAMLLMIGIILLASRYNATDLAWTLTILGVPILLVLGAVIQFRERCPRCSTRLGRQARMFLPNECSGCGVEFPRTDDPHAPRE